MYNLLLIDQGTPDTNFIISSLLHNTKYIMIDTKTQSLNDIYKDIQKLEINSFKNVAIIRHNDRNFFNLPIYNSEIDLANSEKVNEFRDFLLLIKNNLGMEYFDIISCNVYDEFWKRFICHFKQTYNLYIRASSNITGKGGDWILESDNVELIGLYFSKEIENYEESLLYSNSIHVIDVNGQTLACGSNSSGQLGIANFDDKGSLIYSTLISSSCETINVGYRHSFILLDNGSAFSTGLNEDGQLGLGNWSTKTQYNSIASFPSGTKPIKFSCGSSHTLVLLSNGTVYSSGSNFYGQLCRPSVPLSSITGEVNTFGIIESFPSGKIPISVHCTELGSFVLMTDGTLYSCGLNTSGQLGLGNTANKATLNGISGIPATKKISLVATGSEHVFALTTDGSLYSSGNNSEGQLGLGDRTNRNSFQNVSLPSGKSVSYISCGFSHTFVVMKDNSVYACGSNYNGQLGIPTTTLRSTVLTLITSLPINKSLKMITTITNNTYALCDNTLYSVGGNIYGQLAIGSIDNTVNSDFSNINTKYIDRNNISQNANNIAYLATDLLYYRVGAYKSMIDRGYPLSYLLEFDTSENILKDIINDEKANTKQKKLNNFSYMINNFMLSELRNAGITNLTNYFNSGIKVFDFYLVDTKLTISYLINNFEVTANQLLLYHTQYELFNNLTRDELIQAGFTKTSILYAI